MFCYSLSGKAFKLNAQKPEVEIEIDRTVEFLLKSRPLTNLSHQNYVVSLDQINLKFDVRLDYDSFVTVTDKTTNEPSTSLV